MRLSICWLLGLLVFFLPMIAVKNAQAEQSQLLELTQKLHCAETEQEASALLVKIITLPTQPFGIPSDNFSADEKFLLYAATVDILLQVLYETIQRYPKLQETAERCALQWNYCEIITDGKIADLSIDSSGDILKQQAIGPFPSKKKGFGIWGFLKPDPENRYVPKIIQDSSIWSRVHEDLVFRLFQQQCFPHPETGTLVNEPNESQPLLSGSLRIIEELQLGKRYPYLWKSECKKTIAPVKLIELALAPQPVTTVIEVPPIKPAEMPKPVAILKPKLPAKSNPKTDKAVEGKKTILDLVLKKYTQPTKGEVPILIAAIPSANSNAGARLPLPPTGGLGIAGNFYHRAKLNGQMAFGANLGWRPYSYIFIRSGVNYNYYDVSNNSPNSNGQLSYSWGIGYDDWHPGTFSVEIDNWGPTILSKGLALNKAVANIGYNFEALFLRPYNITGSGAIGIPINGDPNISTTWSWSPIENWFIRGSLQRTFGSKGGWSWSYNFGYFDWHPFTFSVSYDNWGTNPIFGGAQAHGQGNAFNFQEKGAVTLSWSWAF
jgi:hypothetical protein